MYVCLSGDKHVIICVRLNDFILDSQSMTTTMVREDEAAAASLTAADWSAGAIVLTVTLGAGAYATCGANGARLAIRTGSSSFSPIKAMVADSALYLAAFLSASTLIGE